MNHGTRACYTAGCRQPECVKANADYQRDYRAGIRKGRKKVEREKTASHGTRSRYVGGCRCEECVQANRDYQRGYMRLHRQGIPWNDPLVDGAVKRSRSKKVRKVLRPSEAARKVIRGE